jgi:hypothetical protein
LRVIVKEIESSTETNGYCTIIANQIPQDIVSIFTQNACLYVFGLPVYWKILSHDSIHISWEIGMEYVDVTCEHLIRYFYNNNIAI